MVGVPHAQGRPLALAVGCMTLCLAPHVAGTAGCPSPLLCPPADPYPHPHPTHAPMCIRMYGTPQSFCQQLLEAVAYMHELRLVHTDLKPENILMVEACCAR